MKAASSVVKKQGVALVTQEDLKSKEEKLGNTNISTLLSKIKDLKKDNKKIIFTNGCFDILHIGHLDYLAKSKLLGDFLIVGLNSDKSVKSLKGPKRPFNNQNDRAYFLEKLEMVDAVVVFDETNPKKLLSKIKPDVLTKADDYKFEDIIGKEHAKNVILIKKKYNTSSTKILEKININK